MLNNKNINFVSPSQWLLDCTKSSDYYEYAISKYHGQLIEKFIKKLTN